MTDIGTTTRTTTRLKALAIISSLAFALLANSITIITREEQQQPRAFAQQPIPSSNGNVPSNQPNVSLSDISSLIDKGNALGIQGNFAEAITYYDRALAVDPNSKEALYNKGNALKSQGNYAEAITYFDKALAVDPNYKLALDGKGNALGMQGNYAEAITYFDKVLAIDPNDKVALDGKQNVLLAFKPTPPSNGNVPSNQPNVSLLDISSLNDKGNALNNQRVCY